MTSSTATTTRHDFRGHRLTFTSREGMTACTLTRHASALWGAHLAPGDDSPAHNRFRSVLREWAADIARELGAVQVEIYARPPAGSSDQDWIVDQIECVD